MSKKILQFIVVFLAVLILLCFFALLYGFYIKISEKQSDLDNKIIKYNLNLDNGHQITDIDLISNDKILFTIKYNTEIYAVIYDINSKKVKKIEEE